MLVDAERKSMIDNSVSTGGIHPLDGLE